ncbi:scrapie-responsive protein 1 [Arapaima gigas]
MIVGGFSVSNAALDDLGGQQARENEEAEVQRFARFADLEANVCVRCCCCIKANAQTKCSEKLQPCPRSAHRKAEMNVLLLSVLLLAALLPGDAIPSNLWSCNRKMLKERDCHSVTGGAELRAIESLHGHFWEGNKCDTVCYCNFRELLCCPSDVFLGPQISFVIPCQTASEQHPGSDPRSQRQ